MQFQQKVIFFSFLFCNFSYILSTAPFNENSSFQNIQNHHEDAALLNVQQEERQPLRLEPLPTNTTTDRLMQAIVTTVQTVCHFPCKLINATMPNYEKSAYKYVAKSGFVEVLKRK